VKEERVMRWSTILIIFFATLFGCAAQGPRRCDINTAGDYSTNNMENLRKCVEADGQYGWLDIDPVGCREKRSCDCGIGEELHEYTEVNVKSDGSSYSCEESCSCWKKSSTSSHDYDRGDKD
jgi:hypothetical protein